MAETGSRVLGLLLVTVIAAACAGTAADQAPSPTGRTAEAGHETAAASPSTFLPRSRGEPRLLLPNLRSLPAEDVQIRPTDDGGRELVFTAALANTGEGPLVVVPDDRPACAPEQRHASQSMVIDTDGDGRYDPRTDTNAKTVPAGCMLDHPTHDHWHFDATASYVLTRPGNATPVVATDKVSFCLRDSRPLDQSGAEEHYGDCNRDSVQGISIGFADVYDTETDGQELPLADDLPDGLYCLTLTADPQQLLRETDDDDNAATIGVQITGETATGIPNC